MLIKWGCAHRTRIARLANPARAAVLVRAAQGATGERSGEAMAKVLALLRGKRRVPDFVGLGGFIFFGQGQNTAQIFVSRKPWDERRGKDNSAETIIGKATAAFADMQKAMIKEVYSGIYQNNLQPLQKYVLEKRLG